MEAFEEIFDDFSQSNVAQIQGLLSNYGISEEDLVYKFEAKKTNWQTENSDQFNRLEAPFMEIYQIVMEELQKEKQNAIRKSGAQQMGTANAYATKTNPQPINNMRVKALDSQGSSLMKNGQEKATLIQRIVQSKKNAQATGSKPQKIEHDMDSLYISRKSRGDVRNIFNEKIPQYQFSNNRDGCFNVQVNEVPKYDILNLTNFERVNSLQKHFEIIQEIMKHQVRAESFNDLGDIDNDCQRIIGRVVAFSHEEAKISEGNIQKQKDKPLGLMIAKGPYTFTKNLSYSGLYDFLGAVRKNQPHAVIMMGPFVDYNNSDINDGCLFYDGEGGKDLVETIAKQTAGMNTKVIFVPSHLDIHHLETLPQQPFHQRYFKSMFTQAVVVGNPSTFRLNDLKIGVINADMIKDMCSGLLSKNMDPPKIDLSLRGILEQRIMYPVYPPSSSAAMLDLVPIEFSQIDKLMLHDDFIPDILITPSDLIPFTKNIEGCVCINPGSIIKNDQGGTFQQILVEPFDYTTYRGDPNNVDLRVRDRLRVEIVNI